MIRITVVTLLSAYLGAGLFAGLLMQRAIPAMNPLGVAYVAATWPRQIICARVESGCSTQPPERIAPYLFSFGESK